MGSIELIHEWHGTPVCSGQDSLKFLGSCKALGLNWAYCRSTCFCFNCEGCFFGGFEEMICHVIPKFSATTFVKRPESSNHHRHHSTEGAYQHICKRKKGITHAVRLSGRQLLCRSLHRYMLSPESQPTNYYFSYTLLWCSFPHLAVRWRPFLSCGICFTCSDEKSGKLCSGNIKGSEHCDFVFAVV